MMDDYILTTKEAQHIVISECKGVYSISGVRQLIYRRKIKAKKVLGRIRISRSSLYRYSKAQNL